MNNNHLPILGAQKPRLGANIVSLVRSLDEAGTFEASGVIQGPEGFVGITQREDYMDATDLLGAIRIIVREEIASALGVDKKAPGAYIDLGIE